ncbi:MAG: ABC transporter permease [Rhodobacteraceae bacterium]|jgi:spermidine/putrescine transport system permease protein|nr:ABC transporter permease [Paracoccaceae bacterium]
MSGTVSQGILNDRIWPLILPAAAVFLALGVGPLLWMFVISFWRVDVFRIAPDLTLRNYIDAVSLHGRALASTMALGIAVAAICTVLSIAVATVIRFAKPRTGQILLFLVLVTLFGGYLTKIYAWKTILGNDGVINSGLLTAGIISTPIEQLLYSPAAVIAAMVGFLLPFAVLPVAGALRAVEMIEIEAARDLGTGPAKLFRLVILPRIRRGVIAAFLLCFCLAVGDYITPILVGGGRTALYGQMIAPQFGTLFNWPLGAAMGFTLVVAALFTGAVCAALLDRVLR